MRTLAFDILALVFAGASALAATSSGGIASNKTYYEATLHVSTHNGNAKVRVAPMGITAMPLSDGRGAD